MKVAIASDHGGFEHKEKLRNDLKELGYEVIDFGAYSEASQDYPDFVYPTAKAVANQEADVGIVVCGTGIGASIVANKVKGIRCGLVSSVSVARLTREHNNTNMLALAGRTTSYEDNFEIAKTWLETAFSHDERHQRRIDKISELEIKEGRQ